mmetsp:Transcript_12857/g.30151  ORF Transcript_12857/g.30151 Transcript_12857/m.30151 type:complete len:347 (-) Transcript_12857:3495-4535(-)
MPSTANMTSHRCSMAKRMMRSNMWTPLSVLVAGRGLAGFRLDDEATRRRVLRACLQAGRHLGALAVASTQLDRYRRKAARRTDEHDGLALHGLDGVSSHRDRDAGFASRDLDVHEQAGTPCGVGVVDNDARLGRAGLLANQGADIGHLADGLLLEGGGLDDHVLADAHLRQVARGHIDLSPDGLQIRDGEDVGVLTHLFTQRDVLLNDDPVEGRAQLEPVQGRRVRRRANCLQLLACVGDGDLGFAHGLLSLLNVLLGRDSLFEELLLTFVGRASQLEALLGVLKLGSLVGDAGAADDSQDLALHDLLTQGHGDRFHNATNTRHDVSGPVFVEGDLAGQLERRTDG